MLLYNTRDSKGADIVKEVIPKEYKTVEVEFTCLCGKRCTNGINVGNIVSSNFTDWQYVSDYVCTDCAKLFSLFKYSYIINGAKIRLLNVREMAVAVQEAQEPPFKIIISKSQKKHLFYKAAFNTNAKNFAANLEGEQISCSLYKLREQFTFISALQALGESKERLSRGNIRLDILSKIGAKRASKALEYLAEQLKTRQIQIPLFLAQKSTLIEEETICNLDLILNR